MNTKKLTTIVLIVFILTSIAALVVDGVVKFSGKVPSAQEVKRLIS